MSIANKLTYLNQTKELIKQGINNIGGELKEYSTFRSYADELDKLNNNRLKVYGEGTEFVLTPSLNNIQLKIISKGNIEQNSLPTPTNPSQIKVVTGENTIIIENEDKTQYQELSLNLGSLELYKKDDYQDEFILENDTWYKNKKIGKVVLNGSENWELSTYWSKTNTNTYYANITNDILFPSFSVKHWITDHFISYTRDELFDLDSAGFCFSGTVGATNVSFTIRINKGISNNVNTFKTWLSNNNVTIYYVLATPVREEITDITLISQLNALYNALSYSKKTYIETESENGNAQLIVSAETECLSSGILTQEEYNTVLEITKEILEYPYTELEYIQSTGTQYINTGHTITATTDIEITFETTGTNSFYGRVFGTSGDMRYELADTGSTSNYRISIAGSSTNFNSLGKKTVKLTGSGVVYLDSVQIANLNKTFSGQVLYLLTGNGIGSNKGKIKLYSCKIWNNGSLIRDYIPAVDEEQVVCLYDLVNDTFTYNSGSGNFIAGGVI